MPAKPKRKAVRITGTYAHHNGYSLLLEGTIWYKNHVVGNIECCEDGSYVVMAFLGNRSEPSFPSGMP